MPDGVTHAEIGAVGAVVATVLVASTYDWPVTRSFIIGSAVGVLALTPDLDQPGTTFTEKLFWSIPIVGWLTGLAFQWFWFGYAKMIPRHRHWSSHLPIISTAGRLLYLAIFGGFFLWVYWLAIGQPGDWWDAVGRFIVREATAGFFAGLAVQDFLHWLADMTISVE